MNGRAITFRHLVALAAVVGITATAFLAGQRVQSQSLDVSVVAQQSTVVNEASDNQKGQGVLCEYAVIASERGRDSQQRS